MSLAARYRHLPRTHRVMWVVGPLLIATGIGLAVWFGLAASVGKPLWGNLSYEVQDDRRTAVTYQVTKPADRAVACTVVAKGIDHQTVGQVDDVIPPGPEKRLVRTTVVRTTTRAVMGEVTRCRTQDG